MVGVLTKLRSTYLLVEVVSTVKSDSRLLGTVIRVPLPRKLPIYFKGRYATRKVLRVGDAISGGVVTKWDGHYRMPSIDDLGR